MNKFNWVEIDGERTYSSNSGFKGEKVVRLSNGNAVRIRFNGNCCNSWLGNGSQEDILTRAFVEFLCRDEKCIDYVHYHFGNLIDITHSLHYDENKNPTAEYIMSSRSRPHFNVRSHLNNKVYHIYTSKYGNKILGISTVDYTEFP